MASSCRNRMMSQAEDDHIGRFTSMGGCRRQVTSKRDAQGMKAPARDVILTDTSQMTYKSGVCYPMKGIYTPQMIIGRLNSNFQNGRHWSSQNINLPAQMALPGAYVKQQFNPQIPVNMNGTTNNVRIQLSSKLMPTWSISTVDRQYRNIPNATYIIPDRRELIRSTHRQLCHRRIASADVGDSQNYMSSQNGTNRQPMQYGRANPYQIFTNVQQPHVPLHCMPSNAQGNEFGLQNVYRNVHPSGNVCKTSARMDSGVIRACAARKSSKAFIPRVKSPFSTQKPLGQVTRGRSVCSSQTLISGLPSALRNLNSKSDMNMETYSGIRYLSHSACSNIQILEEKPIKIEQPHLNGCTSSVAQNLTPKKQAFVFQSDPGSGLNISVEPNIINSAILSAKTAITNKNDTNNDHLFNQNFVENFIDNNRSEDIKDEHFEGKPTYTENKSESSLHQDETEESNKLSLPDEDCSVTTNENIVYHGDNNGTTDQDIGELTSYVVSEEQNRDATSDSFEICSYDGADYDVENMDCDVFTPRSNRCTPVSCSWQRKSSGCRSRWSLSVSGKVDTTCLNFEGEDICEGDDASVGLCSDAEKPSEYEEFATDTSDEDSVDQKIAESTACGEEFANNRTEKEGSENESDFGKLPWDDEAAVMVHVPAGNPQNKDWGETPNGTIKTELMRIDSCLQNSKGLLVNTKYSKAERPLINTCVERLGWRREELSPNSGHIIWLGSSVPDHDHLLFLRSAQIVNRFPGMWDLTKKRMLSKILQIYEFFFPTDYDFSPSCWVLPDDKGEIEKLLQTNTNEVYILKPDGGAMGSGVHLISRYKDIDSVILRGDGNYVMQKYVGNPRLLAKKKFDLRIYAAIFCANRVPKLFISRMGMARFCTEDYKYPSRRNIDNPFMHLTNYSINKDSDSFVRSANAHDANQSKRMLDDVLLELQQDGVNVKDVWNQIKTITAKTFVSLYPWLNLRYRHVYRNAKPSDASKCFQLLGLDIILDDNGKCWLLEVNSNPSLRIDYFDSKYEGIDVQLESAVDRHIKEPVISDCLAIASKLLLSPVMEKKAKVAEKAKKSEGSEKGKALKKSKGKKKKSSSDKNDNQKSNTGVQALNASHKALCTLQQPLSSKSIIEKNSSNDNLKTDAFLNTDIKGVISTAEKSSKQRSASVGSATVHRKSVMADLLPEREKKLNECQRRSASCEARTYRRDISMDSLSKSGSQISCISDSSNSSISSELQGKGCYGFLLGSVMDRNFGVDMSTPECNWMPVTYKDMEKCIDCFNVLGLRFQKTTGRPTGNANGRSDVAHGDRSCKLLNDKSLQSKFLSKGKAQSDGKKVTAPYRPFLKKDRMAAKRNSQPVKASYTKLHKDILKPLSKEYLRPQGCWLALDKEVEDYIGPTKIMKRLQMLYERLVNFPSKFYLERLRWIEICNTVKIHDILRKVQVPIETCRIGRGGACYMSSNSSVSRLNQSLYSTTGSSSIGRSPSSSLIGSVDLSHRASRLAFGTSSTFSRFKTGNEATQRLYTSSNIPRRRRLCMQDLESLWLQEMHLMRRQTQLQDSNRGIGLLEFWRIMSTMSILFYPYIPPKSKLVYHFLEEHKMNFSELQIQRLLSQIETEDDVETTNESQGNTTTEESSKADTNSTGTAVQENVGNIKKDSSKEGIEEKTDEQEFVNQELPGNSNKTKTNNKGSVVITCPCYPDDFTEDLRALDECNTHIELLERNLCEVKTKHSDAINRLDASRKRVEELVSKGKLFEEEKAARVAYVQSLVQQRQKLQQQMISCQQQQKAMAKTWMGFGSSSVNPNRATLNANITYIQNALNKCWNLYHNSRNDILASAKHIAQIELDIRTQKSNMAFLSTEVSLHENQVEVLMERISKAEKESNNFKGKLEKYKNIKKNIKDCYGASKEDEKNYKEEKNSEQQSDCAQTSCVSTRDTSNASVWQYNAAVALPSLSGNDKKIIKSVLNSRCNSPILENNITHKKKLHKKGNHTSSTSSISHLDSNLSSEDLLAWHESVCAQWPRVDAIINQKVNPKIRRDALKKLIDFFELKLDLHSLLSKPARDNSNKLLV